MFFNNLLKLEQNIMNYFAPISIILFLSGFLTWFIPDGYIWEQWLYLLHVFIGFIWSILIALYVFVHVKRTVQVKRAILNLTGFISLVFFLYIVFSGGYLAFYGRTQTNDYIYDYHVMTSFVGSFALIAHILGHLVKYYKSKVIYGKYLSFSVNVSRYIIKGYLTILVLCIVIVTFTFFNSKLVITNNFSDYEYPYGDQPFEPSKTTTPDNQFLSKKYLASSRVCASCHQDIYKQWSASIHRHAAKDPAYEKNVALLTDKKGIAATRYCEGCHAPIALLAGQLTKGGVHGGINDTPANEEGVNCISCHAISRINNTQGVASYHLTQENPYLFDLYNGGLNATLTKFLIRLNSSPHKKQFSVDKVNTSEFCATCHAQFMDKELNNWGWVKMQDDYSAWLSSPFSGFKEKSHSQQTVSTCQNCHFPKVKGNDPSSDANGFISSHLSLGSNTFVPLHFGDIDHAKKTERFLSSGKVRVAIDVQWQKLASQDLFNTKLKNDKKTELPSYVYNDQDFNFNVIVSNHFVGHDFPAGAIDLHQAWLEVTVSDHSGKVVFQSGNVNAQGDIVNSPHIYQTIPIDKHGEHVWKHDLFNMIGDSYKKVIPSGSADTVNYNLKVPSWVKGKLIIHVKLNYRKLNKKYYEWVTGESINNLPVINMSYDTLSIPIIAKREVSNIY